MLAAARSELVRMRRPGILLGWFGLTALFAVMVNTVMFSHGVAGSGAAAGSPGRVIPERRGAGRAGRDRGRAVVRVEHVRPRDALVLGPR